MKNLNPMYRVDAYKLSHAHQYPKGLEELYFNFTPRSNKYANLGTKKLNKVVFFGLQGFIKRFLQDEFNFNFFYRTKAEAVNQLKYDIEEFLGTKYDISYIKKLYDLGYLPIKIKALKEGSKVNVGVPLFTVTSTHKDFAWFAGYIETFLSAECWKSSTQATIGYEFYKLFLHYANLTSDSTDFVKFQGHNFASRGMSGSDDDVINNSAWLLSFYGTDSFGSVKYLNDRYDGDESKIVGTSIPAGEHSCTCLNILKNSDNTSDGELEYLDYFISTLYPSGIVSYVSDSYDYWNVISKYTVKLKDKILARAGKLVFRPDSSKDYSDPYRIICGWEFEEVQNVAYENIVKVKTPVIKSLEENKYYLVKWESDTWKEQCDLIELSEEEVKGSIDILWDVFGGTHNSKGFKVLNEKVGLIYGDGITYSLAEKVLNRLYEKGYSTSCVVFGIGSYQLSGMINRDFFGFAYKCTHAIVDGENIEVYKDPITDSGTKKSLKGYIRVEKEGDDYKAYDQQTKEDENRGELEVVFNNSGLIRLQSLDEIREILFDG